MTDDLPTVGMFGAAGFSFFAGMTLNDLAVIVGIFVALAGLAINWWHKRQIVQLAERRLNEEMELKRLELEMDHPSQH